MAKCETLNAVKVYQVDVISWRVKILIAGRPRYASSRMWVNHAIEFAYGVRDEAHAHGKHLELILPAFAAEIAN